MIDASSISGTSTGVALWMLAPSWLITLLGLPAMPSEPTASERQLTIAKVPLPIADALPREKP